ncbi:hypothetical protein AKJ16_DCAP13149 [Drosera capensis]
MAPHRHLVTCEIFHPVQLKQRPPFFSFKMGISSAIRQSLRLSIGAYLFSGLLILLLPQRSTRHLGGRSFFAEQLVFLVGSFVVMLSWELTQHLHKVLHTKRFTFAMPKGSAAAETNPTEPLLAALEESPPRSLHQYLAYLDLYMICGSNIGTWKRAAFFEETGETYKRIIEALLGPGPFLLVCSSSCRTDGSLSQGGSFRDRPAVRKPRRCSLNPVILPTGLPNIHGEEDSPAIPKLHVRSCWHQMGHDQLRLERDNNHKKSDCPSQSKAYALADIFKISIYRIVAEFHEEMLRSAKEGLLEKDWLSSGEKPMYGSRDVLARRLQLFLGFQPG